ncbi:hypothetical protein KSP40_PGU022227 [Platanthera guangdongensis]|uniref:Uncharacterized protein n=1 Tax=Platanthera guangdongensis TaxID=2320717 RepID=A0ABR2MXX9_9ASPA
MMHNVPAGAISGEEHRGEAHVGIVDPSESVEAVVIRGRKAVLGREEVFDGDDTRVGGSGDATTQGIIGEAEGGVVGEAAAVEVDDDRDGGVGLDCGGGEESDPKASGSVDGVIGGRNPLDRLGAGFRLPIEGSE